MNADDRHPCCEDVDQDKPPHQILSSNKDEASFYKEPVMGQDFRCFSNRSSVNEVFAPYGIAKV